MSRIIHIGLIVGATISFAAASLTSVHALDVSRVQLGVADLGGVACPRDAKVTAWAHTDGPGTVKFIIRNDGGGKTGELSANAVKGPTGNWLATYSQTFKVTTDVSIRYKAEAVGHGKSSNWVNFKATCGPQVRTSKGTATKSGAKPPAKKASDANRPQPRTKKTTKNKRQLRGPLVMLEVVRLAAAVLVLAFGIFTNQWQKGFSIWPTFLTLVLLGLPPVFTNAFTAVRGVDPAIREAATGMGMNRAERLRRVELPLATPLLLTGLRLAAVQIVATATLGAWVGFRCLGTPIFEGFAQQDDGKIIAGAALVAALTILTEVAFSVITRRLTPWEQRGTSPRGNPTSRSGSNGVPPGAPAMEGAA